MTTLSPLPFLNEIEPISISAQPLRLLWIGDAEAAAETEAFLTEDNAIDAGAWRRPWFRAEDVAGALALARLHAPHAIVCDLSLHHPEMAADLCHRLRAAGVTRSIPLLIVVPENSRDYLLQEALAAGADDFLSHPLCPIEFRTRLRSIARRSAQQQALHRALQLRTELGHRVAEAMRGPLARPGARSWDGAVGEGERLGRELDHLLQDLLDLGGAKQPVARLPLDRGEATLEPLFDEALRHLAPVAVKCGVELRRFRSVAEARAVGMDRELMGRAIERLLEVALMGAPAGSVVTLSAAADAKGIAFAISDQGPGLPSAYRDILDGKRNRRLPAPAAGLAFAREIAEAHGGRLTWERIGEQSRFTFTWPG